MNGWMNKWWDDRSRDPCKHIECSEGNGRKKNMIDSHPFALLSFVSTCYPCWLSALASLKENKSCQWKLLEVRFIIPRSSLRIRTRKSRNNFSKFLRNFDFPLFLPALSLFVFTQYFGWVNWSSKIVSYSFLKCNSSR